MDPDDDIPDPLDALVTALIGWGGIASQIVHHMWRTEQVTGETEPPLAEALHEILAETLRGPFEQRAFEMGVAARVVEDVIERVTDEIYLVPPPNRAARRSRRRRRR